MEAVIQLLCNYLKEKDTDYAVMLTGAWGSGKTFYVRNKIPETISQIQILDENDELKFFEMLYLSVKGVDSIQSLRNKILISSQIGKASWLPKVADTINGIKKAIPYLKDIDVQSIVATYFGLKRNQLLVIDDLERVTKISAKDVIAFLSDYFEIEGNKVLVIANKQRLSLDEETIEKYFRYTISYEPDIKAVIDNIVDQYANDDTKTIFELYKQKLEKALKNSANRNFRTLKFFIESSNRLLEEVSDFKFHSPEVKGRCLNRALDCLFILCLEFKHKKYSEISGDLIQVLKGVNHPSLFWFLYKDIWDDNKVKSDTPSEIYQESIYNEFIKNGPFHPYYSDIFTNYLNEGVWDNLGLENYFEELNTREKANMQSDEIIAKNRLSQPLLLEDSELPDLLSQVKSYLFDSKYSLGEIFDILGTFDFALDLNLINIIDDSEFEDLIEIGKSKLSGTNTNVQRYYEGFSKGNYAGKFYDAMVMEQALLKATEGRSEMCQLFGFINSAEIEKFTSTFDDVSAFYKIIFSEKYLSASELSNCLYKLSNVSKQLFAEWLYRGYLTNGIHHLMDYRKPELPYLKILIAQLTEATIEGPIAQWHITRIKSLFQQAIDEIENGLS